MDLFTIDDPRNRSYPFSRDMFEDSFTLYHGSWSSWARLIERDGIRRGRVPFAWTDVATVYEARRAVGQGSYLPMFLGKEYPRQEPPRDVFFSADFWTARSYATDGGGEVIRTTVEEAAQFERLYAEPHERQRLIQHWRAGLAESPGHGATESALRTLTDNGRMAEMHSVVSEAKARLLSLVADGHPVIYAVRVEADWFRSTTWEQHVDDWQAGRRQVDMRCLARDIPVDRFLARVAYPNGTESDFGAAWCASWSDAQSLGEPPSHSIPQTD